VVWKGLTQVKWVVLVFVAVMVVDSLLMTAHYFQAEDITGLKKGNIVTDFIQEHQGGERSFFVDSRGIYNRWIAVDRSYHGLNLFNIWQMNRMPSEYKEFLGTVGRNPVRMWELSSIKYVAAPAGILQQLKQNPAVGKLFKPVLNYQVPTARGMRPDVLLEFSGSISRLALIYGWDLQPLEKQCKTLASPQHDPHVAVLLDPSAGIPPHKGSRKDERVHGATFSTRDIVAKVVTSEPAILRFSQYYQPGWKVFVDGKEAKLLRVDYLCMGVSLAPGEHVVVFKCPRSRGALFVFIVLLISLVGGLLLIRKGHQPE
jgi:hypothetical protein